MQATIKRHDRQRSEKLDFIVPGFTNYNPSDDPSSIGDTIVAAGLNFMYDSSGSLQSAKGYVRVNTTNLPAPTDNGWLFETSSIRQLIVATTAGSIYKYDNAGAWTLIGGPYTSAQRWDGCMLNGKLFLVNGVDGILQWDGTAMTLLAVTGYSAIAPQYITQRKNRLYLTEKNSGLVWFSNPLDPSTIQPNAYQNFEPNNGHIINGLGSTGDSVQAFKDNRVINLIGEPLVSGNIAQLGNLQMRASNSEVGAIAYKTIVTIAKGVQVFAATSGIYVHQNYQTHNIAPELDQLFRSDMNPNFRHLMWATYSAEEKKLLVGYCSNVSTTPDKVIMLDLSQNAIKYALWDDYPCSFAIPYKFTNTPITLFGSNIYGMVMQGFIGYGHLAGDNGSATSGSTTTIVDTTKNWTTNQFVNSRMQIVSATGYGQQAYVTSNTATTLTISPALATAAATGSVYTIGGYHSFADTKIFNFGDPALTKKYKFLNLFLDTAAGNYPINVGVAYGKLALSYTTTASLYATTWFYESDNSLNGWVWGSASLAFGSTVSLYDQVNLGGNDRFIQVRIGTFKNNQPWRCSQYSFTFREKKARPN